MAYEYVSAADPIICTVKCTRIGLLVADPEDGCPHDEQYDEENGPRIHMAVGLTDLRVIIHCIPLVGLIWVAAKKRSQSR